MHSIRNLEEEAFSLLGSRRYAAAEQFAYPSVISCSALDAFNEQPL